MRNPPERWPGGFLLGRGSRRKGIGAAWAPIEPGHHFPDCHRYESGFCRSEPVDTGWMSCVEITPEMSWLLAALRSWQVDPELPEELRATQEWEQARAWGWIMESGALTGTGARHAGEQPRGILLPDL